MSRYIDADALKYYGNHIGDEYEDRFHDAQWAYRSDIENAPSIDICFCRECKRCSKDRIKWSVKDEDGNWIDTKCNLCRRTKLEVNLDDFCSYGQKEVTEREGE